MRVRIVAVGKLKERHYRAAVDDYLARLKHYTTCEEIELKDDLPRVLTQSIRKALLPHAHVVALTIGSRARSSEEFAAFVEGISHRAIDLSFIIGGADGIPDEVVRAADEEMSLSKMTLPHQLARLVLVEQLYRAMTIRKGEPYHH
ncbi:MAG: 23S rRNA (pseudouridine(1915)-N(3))-methyltransferase RlmH [Polyangiales bacterium]